MSHFGRSRTITLDLARPEWSAARIAALPDQPDAVVAGDDSEQRAKANIKDELDSLLAPAPAAAGEETE